MPLTPVSAEDRLAESRVPARGAYGSVIPWTVGQLDGSFNQGLACILWQTMELDLGATAELNPVAHGR